MVQHISWEWLLEGFKFELETQVKPKTVEYYYDHARIFAHWVQSEGRISEPYLLTKRDVQGFLHHFAEDSQTLILRKGVVQQIQRTDHVTWPYYRALKRFFSWAVQEGYLECNPLDGIVIKAPKPRPVEPYRVDHIEKMFSVLDHDWKVARTPRQKMLAARDKATLMLFLESGLRLGELAGLKATDVDFAGQRAMVRESKMGKGRMVGFGPQTKKALWRYLGLRGDGLEHDALWITEEGQPLTKHGVQEIIRRLKRDAGLEHVRGSVHKLRHTFATTYLRHTRDMKGCRLLLGHSTLAMTERYTQFIEAEDALKAYEGKGPLDWMRT